MRPVKKALRALDNPDQTLSEAEQMNRTRACLRQIGNQIDMCLDTYWDADKKVEWRSNLWYFVSKFTNFDAKKLYRLYKYSLKKGDGIDGKNEKESKSTKDNVKFCYLLKILFVVFYLINLIHIFVGKVIE